MKLACSSAAGHEVDSLHRGPVHEIPGRRAMKRRNFLLGTTGAAAALTRAASSEANPRPPTGQSSVLDPTYIDARVDSHSISFENLTGARGNGGKAYGGRKGRPSRILDPNEKVVLGRLPDRARCATSGSC